ncbi:hypothetical protein JQK88_26880 [Mesorhizobium caraganae]|uniref:hypothetical protein n=1 Tax=Mesorhizobium caraganae TaxID=483206 RepID=UPI00177F9CCE|nr:hypothetical protein [Mesorhizobium caraganae]MBM2714786.1 hypothetical protein [Mesorhizobium caraganae]
MEKAAFEAAFFVVAARATADHLNLCTVDLFYLPARFCGTQVLQFHLGGEAENPFCRATRMLAVSACEDRLGQI